MKHWKHAAFWLTISVLLLVAFIVPVHAQAAGKTVTLTWTDSTNPAATTYSVYRAPGLCSGTPSFTAIQTGVTVKKFVDQPGIGGFCYKVDAVFSGIESSGSNSVNPTVPPVEVTLAATVP